MALKVFTVSEKDYEIKQVKEFLNRLPYAESGKEDYLNFYSSDTPKAGLEKIEADHRQGIAYDLFIVSHKMKSISGIQFVKALNSKKESSPAPVMLIVEQATKELVSEALAAGIAGFLILPFSKEGFQTSMAKLASILIARERKRIGEEIRRLESLSKSGANPEAIEDLHQRGGAQLQKIRRFAPWSGEVNLSAAEGCIDHGQFASAIPLLKATLKADINNRKAHAALLACYKKTGQSMEESSALKKLLASDPTSPALLLKAGDAILSEGNYREAALYFRKAIQNCSASYGTRLKAKSHIGLGKAMIREGDESGDTGKHEQAREEFKEALAADPTLISVYMNLIAVYKKLGMTAEVKLAMEQAVTITPDSAEAWLELFRHYLNEGEMKKAKFSLQKAIQHDPENQITLVCAGQMYYENHLFGEAVALFEKASGINPSDTRIYNFLGICYRRMNLGAQSVENYRRAIQIDPEDYNLHFNLGRAFQHVNDAPLAVKSFEAALKLNPELTEARSALDAIASGSDKTMPGEIAGAG